MLFIKLLSTIINKKPSNKKVYILKNKAVSFLIF